MGNEKFERPEMQQTILVENLKEERSMGKEILGLDKRMKIMPWLV